MILINHSRLSKIVPISRAKRRSSGNTKTGSSINTPIKTAVNAQADTSTDISMVIQKDSWIHRKCFILGGGTSLSGFDFNRLRGELVIGINKSFASFPVQINYSSDFTFYDRVMFPKNDLNPHLHTKWVEFQGIKLFLKKKDHRYPGVYTVKSIDTKTISGDPATGIYAGKNSGLGALMLAISFGCKQIGLLGYDMKVDHSNMRTHHHEGYRTRLTKDVMVKEDDKLSNFNGEFEEFAPTIQSLDIKVFNLNPDSGMTCFPKIELKDFIKR